MTPLSSKVTRRTNVSIRDRGKIRDLVAVLYPNGTIGLRPLGTRQMEITTLDSVYSLAVKQRVAKERAEKKARKTDVSKIRRSLR